MSIKEDGSLILKKSYMELRQPGDSMYPDVFVGKLSDSDRQTLAEGKPVKGIKLGVNENSTLDIQLTEALAQELHAQFMKQAEDAYVLLWEGNKIPRGAEVSGHRIGWTQNGVVQSTDGQMIGVYDRIMEWGGASGKEQQMIVFVMKANPTSIPQA